MDTVNKQAAGLDMSKKEFKACFKELQENGKITIKGSRTFANNVSGFKEYLTWSSKRKKTNLVHVMEATGVYHEELCYFLYQHAEQVSVQLPQKVKYFIKSLNLKTKTDRSDAMAIAQMGILRNLERWQPLSEGFKQIRDMCRTLAKLKKGSTAAASQLHAMKTSHSTFGESIQVLEKLKDTYDNLIDECQKKILEMVKQDKQLYQRIEKITAIKGVGTLTVVKLLAETDGFRNSSSIRKLVSYAGLDVVHKESGQYVGTSRISKKGNPYIRAALYMPALSARNHDKRLKPFYERLEKRLPKKKQAIVAVMRKILILVYTLWKNGQNYDPKHQWNEKAGRTPLRIA